MEATCPIIEDTFGAHFKNHPLPQKGTVKVNQEKGASSIFWYCQHSSGLIPAGI